MFANVGTNLHSSPAVDETIDMFNYDPTVRAAGNMDPDNTMELFKSPLRQSKSKRTSLSTTLNMFDTPEKVFSSYCFILCISAGYAVA